MYILNIYSKFPDSRELYASTFESIISKRIFLIE